MPIRKSTEYVTDDRVDDGPDFRLGTIYDVDSNTDCVAGGHIGFDEYRSRRSHHGTGSGLHGLRQRLHSWGTSARHTRSPHPRHGRASEPAV